MEYYDATTNQIIELNDNANTPVINNNSNDDNRLSIINLYGEDLTDKSYVTNPAIKRDEEIMKMTMILLTPEKSALLVGKAGIGKTSIVEGLAYRIINNNVPDKLKGYRVIKINSSTLVGKINNNGREELVISVLVEELKHMEKVILFIDEIHTLIGAANESMDLANILKPAIDRGSIKIIGATTDIEYNTYIVRDRAFLRRFDRVDVMEQDADTTVQVLMGSLPKIEHQTGVRFKYNDYVSEMLVKSIVDATSTYKRVYGLGAMYPDICFSVLTAAFSNALYENRSEVNVLDVYMAIKNSKRIYPDSRIKELEKFKVDFAQIAQEDGIVFPNVTIEEIDESEI